MKKEIVKLTVGTMQLQDTDCSASVQFTESDGGAKTPQLQMTGYSGGIIKGHWYWGDLAIDLQGMKIPKSTIPILSEHMTDQKIAFVKKSEISFEDNKLSIVGGTFLDSPVSLSFQSDSAKGFPFEASIYAKPTQIQTLADNETADVNGYTMKGPGTIWRQCMLKEVSVCTFGYDSNTKSAAMSESEEVSVEYINEISEAGKLTHKEDEVMDFLKFKTEHPVEFAKLAAEVTDGLNTQFAAEKATLESTIATITAQNTKLSEEASAGEKRLLALEKAEMIRAEAAMKHTADAAFAQKFAEAGLPDRLSAKIRKMVNHEQFIADGSLDTDAFAAAVDAELKDWANEDGSVLGFSTSSKEHVSSEDVKLSAVNEATAARMASYLNPKK